MVALLRYHRHHCTIKQTSVAQRQRTGIRPFLLHRYYQTHRRDLCRSKYFRHIAFVWLHYCVITATIAQSNKLPLHKDKGRESVLFYCTDITKHTNKTFEKASFSMYIDLFRHTITSALPRTKKPHSVNSLYGFYSTCCNLLLQLKC